MINHSVTQALQLNRGTLPISYQHMSIALSFIIPAYNEKDYLGTCLSTLIWDIRSANLINSSEVIVVNNASTDETEYIARQFPEVQVLNEMRKGPAHARQKGLLVAQGKIVIFLDADNRIPPGWVSATLQEFEQHPNALCISGPCIFYDLPFLWRKIAWVYERVVSRTAHLLTGHFVAGANFAVRKEAIDAVGGFDTSIAFYGEDVELAKRLAAIGEVRYTRNLVVETSARRFNAEGVLKATAVYALNFLAIWLFSRPIIQSYRDIR